MTNIDYTKHRTAEVEDQFGQKFLLVIRYTGPWATGEQALQALVDEIGHDDYAWALDAEGICEALVGTYRVQVVRVPIDHVPNRTSVYRFPCGYANCWHADADNADVHAYEGPGVA